MARIEAHVTLDDDDAGRVLARIHPASAGAVEKVLSADVNSMDGRSNWVWVRLPNGDLILGIYPQGDTYLALEDDARYPG